MFAPLFDFSRTHCIAVCATLLPCSLFMTFGTLLHLGFQQPAWRVHLSAGLAWAGSALMVFHVYTWLAVGVVMLPTYILPFCAVLFTLVNLVAIGYPRLVLTVFAWCGQRSKFVHIP